MFCTKGIGFQITFANLGGTVSLNNYNENNKQLLITFPKETYLIIYIHTFERQINSSCESFCDLVFWLCGLGEVMIKWTEECPDPAKMTEILLTVLNWT